MAYETEISNSAHPTDVVSAGISAALVNKVVCVPLIYAEDLPTGTAVKLFRKDGSLVAEAVNESASYTFSASSELSQATVSATAAKTAVASKLTAEAQQFGLVSLDKIVKEQGAAIARALDDDILALFSGFSTNSVTSTNVLTVNDIMEAIYKVVAALAEPSNGVLNGVFDYKGINEIRKELMTSGAAVFTQASMISLLGNMPERPNGFAGSLPGVNLFQTSGLPTSGGDDIACVFNPEMAFAGMYSPSVNVKTTWVGSGGFWDEIASYVFSKVVEWNDAAGCKVLSDT